MNKQAMISIHPEHAYNILTGKKTLEIRKWIPKDYVGWVHCYVTKGKRKKNVIKPKFYYEWALEEWEFNGKKGPKPKKEEYTKPTIWSNYINYSFDGYIINGKVVAKFWYDGYDKLKLGRWVNHKVGDWNYRGYMDEHLETFKKACLTEEELNNYGKGKPLYAWHINKLTIFDKPRELKDYFTDYDIFDTDRNGEYVGEYIQPTKLLTKAPQRLTWVYEEERE